MKIHVETTVSAPLARVWEAYNNPAEVTQWNFADDSWHCPSAASDLRVGGEFSSRMEAKDGSFGFDFAGTYTKVEPQRRLEYAFGDRNASIDFSEVPGGVKVAVDFDGEETHPEEMQRGGWQAILENFKKHVESK